MAPVGDRPHREVRYHPATGDVAVDLGRQIHGGGQTWLLVHLDDRGDVIATAMHDHEVQDWPQLRLPDNGGNADPARR